MAYIDKYGQPWDSREEADMWHRRERRAECERLIDQAGLRSVVVAARAYHDALVAEQERRVTIARDERDSLNEQRKAGHEERARWQHLLSGSSQQLSALYELARDLMAA
ncbi:MAG: hypothetical protein JSU86_07850 [Phycisphaerales bacterium]|nr:MAG: hypothetical protein JSU86_07850 [Phycisphaerales bacterium]